MHYYKRNIGDYAKKAARLTMLQHGAYTLLIDSCYDREEFPTLEQALDWCWASSQEEIDAVTFVLKKFFTLIDGVFVQKRIKEDLDKYHENAATNKRIAEEREAKRRLEKEMRERSVNEALTSGDEPPPNQEPLTTNQEPLTTKKTRGFTPPTLEDVKAHCFERSSPVDPVLFFDHYEANGWMRGKNKIKDWKACVRTWERRENDRPRQHYQSSSNSLASESERQTRIIQARIAAGEFDQCSMGSDGAALSTPVGESGRPEDGEQPIDAEFYFVVQKDGEFN